MADTPFQDMAGARDDDVAEARDEFDRGAAVVRKARVGMQASERLGPCDPAQRPQRERGCRRGAWARQPRRVPSHGDLGAASPGGATGRERRERGSGGCRRPASSATLRAERDEIDV